ncbi:uncharacterized protein LOC114934933 [Nylanderia fulva]|uniref:uncharacterized protein LOC114934933 n=1 Tax=Nylanderia fulva TaxID=613905 RepID=UPI0010FB0998|nr:uncharacterized protein LOC114934933 [Nylanderia fulva]
MEKQLEALNIDDTFESDQKPSHNKIIRTFSFPSSNKPFFKALEESSKFDRHYSEQILYPNICTRKPEILSEMQARTKNTKYSFNDKSKFPEHFWRTKIDNASSLMPANDQVEYMEVEKYPDLTNNIHDAVSFAPILTNNQEVMEVEKFIDPSECVGLSKSFSTISTMESLSHENSRFVRFKKTIQTVRTKTIKIIRNRKKTFEKTSKCSKVKRALCICFVTILLILSSICVFLFSVPLHEDQNNKHSDTFTTAVVELEKHIFGQDRAIQVLSNYLQQNSPLFKIIALVGGTGVGKTYTAEIIRKKFREKTSDHVFFPSRADLFILDNLKEEHSSDVISFVKEHRKKYGDRYDTVLAIFNVEQMNDDLTRSIDLNKSINTIRNTFADANLNVKIIPYEPLSEDVLEKCIINTAKNVKLLLSQDQIALIKRQLIENNVGCKGAYGKIQVIGRQ